MPKNRENKQSQSAADQRKARLAEALRANLLKRKQQDRARRDSASPVTESHGQQADETIEPSS